MNETGTVQTNGPGVFAPIAAIKASNLDSVERVQRARAAIEQATSTLAAAKAELAHAQAAAAQDALALRAAMGKPPRKTRTSKPRADKPREG